MKKGLLLSITMVALLIAIPSTSLADIMLSFDPVSQEVLVGSSADVALVISGLGLYEAPSLGVFDLDISFDATILDVAGVTFGDPLLGDELDIWDLGGNPIDASITSPGVLNIFEASLDWPWDLDDFQAESFTMATVTFDTLALGTSSLDMVVNILGDSWGDPLTAEVSSGSIAAVPEPGTLLLVSIGIGGLGYLKRKKLIRS